MNKKEALEIVRKNYPHVGTSGSEFETALRELVPELKESEDERIRKLLVWQVHRNIEDDTNDLAGSVYDGVKGHDPDLEESIEDWKKCLAWLEKRKEQNPLSTEETELNSIAFLEQMGYTCIPPGKELKHYTYEQSKQAAEDCYYSKGYNTEDDGRCNEQSFLWGFEEGVDWCEQQKEQKPAEKHTEYPLTPDECIKPTEVHEPSNDELQRHQDELFDFKAFVAKQASEHNILFVRNSDWDNFCTELLSYFNKKQKPAEFDAIKGGDFISDGKRVFLVLANVKERNLGETGSTFCEGHILGVDGVVYCDGDNFKKFKRATSDERAKFIHDLKVGVELKEQPAEWSEEDEKMRDRILEILNKYGNIPVSGGKVQLRFNKEYMWLRHLCERFRPQPHWKPSEEQMEALKLIILNGSFSYVGQVQDLISLKNKLEKL